MSERPKPNTPERAAIFLRNINAVGAVALGGAGIALGSNILIGLGAVNALQAGFFEASRRVIKNQNQQKTAAAS